MNDACTHPMDHGHIIHDHPLPETLGNLMIQAMHILAYGDQDEESPKA